MIFDDLSQFKILIVSNLCSYYGDCPVKVQIFVISIFYHSHNFDYVSNVSTYLSDGFDLGSLLQSLFWPDQYCTDNKLREHVTPWMRASSLCQPIISLIPDLSLSRLTVDEPEDLIVQIKLCRRWSGSTINLDDISLLYDCNPPLFSLNQNFKRNEGSS